MYSNLQRGICCLASFIERFQQYIILFFVYNIFYLIVSFIFKVCDQLMFHFMGSHFSLLFMVYTIDENFEVSACCTDIDSGSSRVCRSELFLTSIFSIAGNLSMQIPKLLHSENINPSLLIMRKEYAWHIAGALQHEETREWVLLYNSSVNGLSFNTFMGNPL